MKKIIAMTFCAALMACITGSSVRAEEVKAGDLMISQAWSRATPNGAKIGVGYFTIENKGTTADKLIGVTGDISGKIELHEMSMNNGVMKMRPVDGGLAIDPGKTVKLAPNGYHLMIMDLKSPLKQGDKVPVTIEFERAGKVAVTLDVQGVGAQGPASGDSMKMSPGMKM
jgi:periplasmic copper chaperone A